jgi:hypothetical protein
LHRSRVLALGAALTLTLGFSPVPIDELTEPLADVPVVPVSGPPIISEGVDLLWNNPDVAAISATFDTERPYLYQSTLHGIDVYDVSVPERPRLVGAAPMAFFQNEAVSMGTAQAREDGTTFVTVGLDLFGVALDPSNPDPQVSGSYVYVIDVTDPTDPHIRAGGEASTSTHTVTCVDAACEYAYTAGNDAEFSIIDLTDLDDPKELKTVESSFGGHDWDQDGAGVMWQVGWNGAAAWDVSDPTDPQLLNTTDEAGTDPEWNNFILHNSIRPNATVFDSDDEPARGRPGPAGPPDQTGRPDEPGRPSTGSASTEGVSDPGELPDFHVDRGNVLLATEEDYVDPTCEDEGNFETWAVDTLDPEAVDARTGALGDVNGGTVTPLDQWNTELLGTGMDNLAGAFCSAHYFDYHQGGLVAQGFYQQGLRLLDVDDPTEIRQVGYWIPQASEVWSAYWVPERNEDGTVARTETGDIAKSDIVYTSDLVRGMDVLQVGAASETPDERLTVEAPVLEGWLSPADPEVGEASADLGDAATGLGQSVTGASLATRAEASPFGSACPLPSLPG